jgi:hypothetical protein
MLKLKDGLENSIIYIPFENRNEMGKFINPDLYPYLYRKHPDLFDVIEDKKIIKNDISINNTKSVSDSNIEREGDKPSK